jgi:hypothetical protein
MKELRDTRERERERERNLIFTRTIIIHYRCRSHHEGAAGYYREIEREREREEFKFYQDYYYLQV